MEQIAADCFNITVTIDTGTPKKNVPSLDDIDNESTVSTCRRLNYSNYSPRNSDISTISDITITTDPTTAIDHTYLKEVQVEGGRYNMAARGHCRSRLPNIKRFLKRSLWYCYDCSIRFRRRTYYCKQKGLDCFVFHNDSPVCLF